MTKRLMCIILVLFFMVSTVSCVTSNPTLPVAGTVVEEVQEEKEELTPEVSIPEDIVDVSKALYTYEEMVGDIDQFKEYYADKLTVDIIGKSVLGKDIYGIILGNPHAQKKVLIHGSIHAREYMTTQLVMKQIEYYLQNYNVESFKGKEFQNIFDKVAIYYIPMVNPDGVTLSQLGLDGITDNNLKENLLAMNGGNQDFSQWKANIKGVDLNLNFDGKWDETGGNKVAGPLNYKGARPESEPESKALADYTREHDFDATVSYHAKGSIIFWYFYQSGDNLNRDKAIAKELAHLTGYSLVSPRRSKGSSGGYKDWHVLEYGRPGFTIEIGSAKSICPLKIDEFPEIWERNRLTTVSLAYQIYNQE